VRHVHYDTVSAEADGVAAMIDERLLQGFRPRDLAILVRSNNDADPFLRALNVRGLPHRFTGNRGLYSREEVRILVSFLRVLANPDDSVPVFHLAGSEMYRVPEIDLLRLNRYAGRKSRPLLEVLRGLPTDTELAGVGGETRAAPARDGLAVHTNCSRPRGEEAQYGLEQCGLAAPIGAEEAQHLARRHREAHPFAYRLPRVAEGQIFHGEPHRYCQPRRETASSHTNTGTPTNAVSTPGGTSMAAMVRPMVSTARR